MKHLLNNISEEEKNSIREQHSGGMKLMNEKFQQMVNKQLGQVDLYENIKYSKFDADFGLDNGNFNNFLSVASQNKETPFFFNGYIFKLKNYGENNEEKDIAGDIHNLKWNVYKPLYSKDGYPYISDSESDTYGGVYVVIRKDMNGLNVETYPDNPSWFRINFEHNKKSAFDSFKNALSTISNKEEVIKLFGNKISERFGELSNSL